MKYIINNQEINIPDNLIKEYEKVAKTKFTQTELDFFLMQVSSKDITKIEKEITEIIKNTTEVMKNNREIQKQYANNSVSVRVV